MGRRVGEERREGLSRVILREVRRASESRREGSHSKHVGLELQLPLLEQIASNGRSAAFEGELERALEVPLELSFELVEVVVVVTGPVDHGQKIGEGPFAVSTNGRLQEWNHHLSLLWAEPSVVCKREGGRRTTGGALEEHPVRADEDRGERILILGGSRVLQAVSAFLADVSRDRYILEKHLDHWMRSMAVEEGHQGIIVLVEELLPIEEPQSLEVAREDSALELFFSAEGFIGEYEGEVPQERRIPTSESVRNGAERSGKGFPSLELEEKLEEELVVSFLGSEKQIFQVNKGRPTRIGIDTLKVLEEGEEG